MVVPVGGISSPLSSGMAYKAHWYVMKPEGKENYERPKSKKTTGEGKKELEAKPSPSVDDNPFLRPPYVPHKDAKLELEKDKPAGKSPSAPVRGKQEAKREVPADKIPSPSIKERKISRNRSFM